MDKVRYGDERRRGVGSLQHRLRSSEPRLRLDVMTEAVCRETQVRLAVGVPVTIVSQSIAETLRVSAEFAAFAGLMLGDFLRAPKVRHVVIGLSRFEDAIELTVWGQGLAATPVKSRRAATGIGLRFHSTARFCASELGAGLVLSLRPSEGRPRTGPVGREERRSDAFVARLLAASQPNTLDQRHASE